MQASSGVTAAEAAEFEAAKSAGNAAFRAGNYPDAVAHYTRAERINPCSALAPANRALVHLKMGDFKAADDDSTVALALLEEFSASNSNNNSTEENSLRIKLFLRRGKARLGLGQLQNAANDYQKVLQVEQRNSDALNALRDLKDRYSVVPDSANGDGGDNIYTSNSDNRPVIDVISSHMNMGANGNGASGHVEDKKEEEYIGSTRRRIRTSPAETGDLTRDFPLLNISNTDAFSALADKWISVAPANNHEFERAWRSIRGRQADRYRYLRVIGGARIRAGLFGNSITAQLLHEIITAFLHESDNNNSNNSSYTDEESTYIFDMLNALSQVPRFGIAAMLMTRAAKQDTRTLLEKMGTNRDLTALRTAFEL